MPTSGVTILELTAGDAIKSAMVELGALPSNDEPEDSERDEAMRRLNNMLKTWSVEANLFREASATATIAGGTGAATLPADVRDVIAVRHIVSATNRRELAQWNRSQYRALPNRATAGNPSAFYYQQGTADVGDQLFIWPVSATDIDLEFEYSRGAYSVTAPDESLDVPVEWQEAVILGLASRCASMFGADKLNPATVSRVDARAEALYQRLLDADRPDSYYFESYSGAGYGY